MQQSIQFLLNFNDYILAFVFLVLIISIAFLIKNKNSNIYDYKYFVTGLVVKLTGVSFFMIVYVLYYKGGDTINYFWGCRAISNLIFQDFEKGIDVLFNIDSPNNGTHVFNSSTGWPLKYMWKDSNTFNVCRFSVPFCILGFNSFLVTSLLISCYSYIGIWKLYRLINILYPGHYKHLAILLLYLPTLVFWGSGIMKDSFVLCSTCWISYNFFKVFIERDKIFMNSIFIIINTLVILNIKAYVILSLLPGMLFWLNSAYLKKINSSLSKVFIFPILILAITSTGYFTFNNLSSLMGVYGDVDTAIQQAQVIQEDLLRDEQYGKNSYNIGEIDGTITGLISVAPIAIFTALFRPLFWEVGSPTMLLSVIENTILILFVFYVLVTVSPFQAIKTLYREPFLLYCFVFSMLFAFGVGIAGTNFGALVRYKTPLVPFFFSMIYILKKKQLR